MQAGVVGVRSNVTRFSPWYNLSKVYCNMYIRGAISEGPFITHVTRVLG